MIKNEIQVGVVSLGCSKNRVDTENMLGYLRALGFTITNVPESADVLIINTCGFIEPAKQESINTILEMAQYKQTGKCTLLAVSGCLSQRYRDDLFCELPEVDLFWGVRDYETFAMQLANKFDMNYETTQVSRLACAPRVLTTPPYSAYLRIADGCSNHCTYCAIPLIRGNMKSVPFKDILNEATRLADNGVSELNVIAQDTSAYGIDLYGELRLPELLNSLSGINGIRLVRLLYTYPDTVTDQLIDVIVGNEKIANYIDIPIQHINNDILEAMHRRGDSKLIKRMFARIREASDDFIIRTSAIVGFPGETPEQFDELMRFFNEYPVNRVGAFTYSPEDNTPASEFENQVPEDIKSQRLDTLMRAQSKISLMLNERRVNTVVPVLVENVQNDMIIGRSYAEAPDVDGNVIVCSENTKINIGDYINVRLTNAREYDMDGELI